MRDRGHHGPAWQVYRCTWTGLFGAACTIGVLVAGLTLSWAAILGLYVAVALPVGASIWSLAAVSAIPERLAVSATFWSGALVVTAQGLTTALGPWSLAALLGLCLGNPDGLAWLGMRLVERRSFVDPDVRRLFEPATTPRNVPDLAALSSLDLDRVWRLSGARLAGEPGVLELDHLARLRRACLDEMEQRDPVRLHQWLRVDIS